METIGDLDLDQILPRFNVQLKHNGQKGVYTLVFELEEIPVELLCFALKLEKMYVVVKSLLQDIVAGQNKRLSLRRERAVIRDNISQN